MSNNDLKARQEFEAALIEKAWSDEDFMQELLSDPHAAITGQLQALHPDAPSVPSHVKIHVHQESADTVHIVLPIDPSSAELSDIELEAVAGGEGCYNKTTIRGCGSGDTASDGQEIKCVSQHTEVPDIVPV